MSQLGLKTDLPKISSYFYWPMLLELYITSEFLGQIGLKFWCKESRTASYFSRTYTSSVKKIPDT